MLHVIRTIHTAIYAVMTVCLVYVLYCGIADRFGPWSYAAFAVVTVECLVFIGNGMRCPLTQFANRLGTTDSTYLPDWLTAWTLRLSQAAYAGCLLLLLYRHPWS